ncbi:MAG: hypothetical protein PHV18_11095 [Lachnospiraceae bacterium]|nr:hypothetical protein [Lachnospiraceae bacterium]
MKENYNTTVMLLHLKKAILMSGEMPELEDIKYLNDDTVQIRYINGGTRDVNVHMDSNLAVMRDVLREV